MTRPDTPGPLLTNALTVDVEDYFHVSAFDEVVSRERWDDFEARVAPNTTVVSTSTRNFPNRLGQGANVYLASAELAAVASVLGRLPTVEEYLGYAKKIDSMSSDIYRYLNFDRMTQFTERADKVRLPLLAS